MVRPWWLIGWVRRSGREVVVLAGAAPMPYPWCWSPDEEVGVLSATVVALGLAPIKGTAWQWRDRVDVDAGGVVGDRAWALVDEQLRCLKTVQHPELMGWRSPSAAELDEAVRASSAGVAAGVESSTPGSADPEAPVTPSPRATVVYWGRPVEAEVLDLTWCSTLGELTGMPVQLARTDQRPGFVWGQPVSVVFASDLVGLPGDLGEVGDLREPWCASGRKIPQAGPTADGLARYRPNLVVDDRRSPLPLRVGSVFKLGDVRLVCRGRITRCAVVNHDPGSQTHGHSSSNVLQQLPDRTLGWGCDVLVGGNVSCGTPVELRPDVDALPSPPAEG